MRCCNFISFTNRETEVSTAVFLSFSELGNKVKKEDNRRKGISSPRNLPCFLIFPTAAMILKIIMNKDTLYVLGVRVH